VPNVAAGGSTEITCDGDAHLFVDDVTINNPKLISFCQWDVVCKAAGGVWDAATNRCTPGVTQVGCEAGGGTWNAGTSSCTRPNNCYVGGFCSQIEKLPDARVWTPAEVAACKAEPQLAPPYIPANTWDLGVGAYDKLGPDSALHGTLGTVPIYSLDLQLVCM
jgi:hypothetical protein